MEKDREDAQKVSDRNALAEAKKLGKEAHAAVKARLAQEQAATSEAKKMEKLRIVAEQKAEKARLAAETRAKQAAAKVRMYSINLDPFSTSFFLRQPNGKRHLKLLKGSQKANNAPSLRLHKYLPQR